MTSRPAVVAVLLLILAASLPGCLQEAKRERPIADAGPNVDAGVGEEVVFDGHGIAKKGSIVGFKWDFDGDGTWDYEGQYGARLHIYTMPGDYHAHLQVVDDAGAKGDSYRWVNVTVAVRINVNWTEPGKWYYVISVPAALEVSKLKVNWTLVDPLSPGGRTYTMDSGIVKVNATTYTIKLPLTRVEEPQEHQITVWLGDLELASRTVKVVNFSKAGPVYNATYLQEVSDYRTWTGSDFSNYYRSGTLVEDRVEGAMRTHFLGKGWEVSNRTQAGVSTYSNLSLSSVTVLTGWGGDWGSTWWRWLGNGTAVSRGEGNLTATSQVQGLERAVENGILTRDDWTRVGHYSGPNGTLGTFSWTRTSKGDMVHVGGNGNLYEVLRIDSVKDFNGTNRGLEFQLHNKSVDFDAARASFENVTVYSTSSQDVGLRNGTGPWSWTNTTWAGFVDDNRDGRWDPDTIPFDPEVAENFTGPRPREPAVGDRFMATDPQGVVLYYEATRTDKANLTVPVGNETVTGVYVSAQYNTTWGHVWHWFWVLADGPRPGLVYEESMLIEHRGYGGGSYRDYKVIRSLAA